MTARAQNWTSRQQALAGAYVNILGSPNVNRKGLIIFNTTGVDLLVNPNATAADATSVLLVAGEALDFAEQPPTQFLWLKAASGNALIWEA